MKVVEISPVTSLYSVKVVTGTLNEVHMATGTIPLSAQLASNSYIMPLNTYQAVLN